MKRNGNISLDMLPQSIQGLVRRRIILRIIIFLLLEIFSALLVVAVLNSSYEIEPISLAVMSAIILLAPFGISGFPHKLIDKPWRGRIISVEIETKPEACMVGGKPILYIKNTIVLTIEKDNGKTCTKQVRSFGSRSNEGAYAWENRDTKHGMEHYAIGDVTHDIENYQVGDEVYHFYCLDDLVVRREGGRSIIECVACSTTNPAYRNECFNCGHTLVHSFENENK